MLHINNLLTESEGSTGKYPTSVLLYWPSDKYEVFRHLIKDKDNIYENNKINKQYGQVRFYFASSHKYVSFYRKNPEIFRGKI
jgi:hypothetical protein